VAQVEDKVRYEQLCNDFRSLNGFLWQTPLIVMTLTGGLWFSVANFELSDAARGALLGFAALADVLMIAALFRLRYVMDQIQSLIRALDARPVVGPNYFIVSTFAILLAAAAAGSAWTACRPGEYFLKRAVQATCPASVAPAVRARPT
jgi:hypothetical protein